MTSTPAVYVTDQMTLTRHVAVDWHVTDGMAWLVTRCGEELPDHRTVNVSLVVAGWWAGCPCCEAPASRVPRNYLDDVVAHDPTDCNCAD